MSAITSPNQDSVPMQISPTPSAVTAQVAPIGASVQTGFQNGSVAPATGDTTQSQPAHDFSSLPPQMAQVATQLMHETNLRRNRHQYKEAIIAYDKILELLPTYIPAWTGKGICFKQLKDTVSAVACFQRGLQLDPTDWTAHDHLGLIYKESELFEKAMEQYKLAIQYGPKDCAAREHLAVVLTDYGTRLKLAGSTEKAVQSYNEALQIHPSYWPSLFNLGVVFSERREFDLAMKYYQMAIEHNPNYVEALCNVGVLCLKEGTMVSSADGSHVPIESIKPGMFLLDESASPIVVKSVKGPMHAHAMFAISSEAAAVAERSAKHASKHRQHTVTPEHLVTLRWNADPSVTQWCLKPGEDVLVLSWRDRTTLQTTVRAWSLSASPELQSMSPTQLESFALSWLLAPDASKNNSAQQPLRNGDLFDIPAETLWRMQDEGLDPEFFQCIDLPIVVREDSTPVVDATSFIDSSMSHPDGDATIPAAPTCFSVSLDPVTGQFRYRSCSLASDCLPLDTLYVLPSASSSPTCSPLLDSQGRKSYSLLQLERAWNLLAFQPAQLERTRIVFAADSGDGGLVALSQLQAKSIISFGSVALPPVGSTTVYSSPPLEQGNRFHLVLRCIAASGGLLRTPQEFDRLASKFNWAPLSLIQRVAGGSFIAVEVEGEHQRFLLADGTVTHNCKNSGELTLSIEYYERALRANPNFAIANSNLSIACTDMGTQVKNEGRLDEGIAYYKRALHHHSKYPAAWYNLGVAYAEKSRFDDAKVCYEMAVLFDSKCAEAYNNLGVLYKDRGNLDQAIHYYGLALAANPKFSQTMNNLAVIYTMLGKLDEAHDYCSRAIKTNPLYAEAHNNLGVLKRDEGRIEEAISAYEECLKIDPLSRNAGQNRLLAMNSLSRSDLAAESVAEAVWRAHQAWGAQFAAMFEKEKYTSWDYIYLTTPPPEDSAAASNNPNAMVDASPASSSINNTPSVSSSASSTPGLGAADTGALTTPQSIPPSLATRRPLRIGYISADFFTHSVSYFIEAPLAYADPSQTHITCYSNVARRDKKTQHLQNLAHAWRAVHDQTAKQVAQQMRNDRIDILVELTGHTAGNRLDVLALKPAPIQVTWIGYPNTTGLPSIDYRFSDEIVDPLDTQQQYSEELVRLDGPFLCYTPPSEAPPVAPTPAASKGYITFGSFNNLAKVNDSVLNAWCRILKSVPNSRMLIKCKPFASPTVCTKMWKRFAELGVESDRVDLVSLLPTTSEHLDSYSNVDISVDTFPYAGTTTTCEALYCGVPVVTYQRVVHPNHAHNVGASLLSRIEGMNALIAKSEDEYVSIAVGLAQDLPKLQQLRASLRPAMLASPLCDGARFVANLTQTYQTLWKRFCEGKGPRPNHK